MMMLATLGGSWLRGVYLNNGHLGHWPRPPLRTNGSGRSRQLLCRYWCKPTPARERGKTRHSFDSCFSLDIYVSYISRRQAHKSGATKYEQLYQSLWLYLMLCYFLTARALYFCNLCRHQKCPCPATPSVNNVNIMNSRCRYRGEEGVRFLTGDCH